MGNSTGKSVNLDDSEKFIVDNYKLLIENAPKLNYFPTNQFIKLFLLKMQRELKISSIAQIAIKLKINKVTVYNWIYGTCKATQYSLLKISYILKTTIFQMIYKKDIFEVISFDEKEKLSLEGIRFELMLALKMEKPITVSAFSKKTGANEEIIESNFPDLYSELVERERVYKEYLILKNDDYVKTLLLKALEYEEPISLTKLANNNQIPVRRLRKAFPELSKEVSGRYMKHLSNIKKIRIKKSINELEQAINKFHEKGIYPSSYKVSQEISDRSAFLYKEVKEVWEKRMHELGYKSNK